MNFLRKGSGPPLLLIHGLGGNRFSFQTILDDLAVHREIIAVDLPGFGDTPRLQSKTSISALADEVTKFLKENDLMGIDAVGSSMGARLVLELARRGGIVGAVVALDPGGFWKGWERHFFYSSIYASIRIVRTLHKALPKITRSAAGRLMLFAQFSAKPSKLSPSVVLDEMKSYVHATAFDELLYELAYGEEQLRAPQGSIKTPLVIVWGRQDHVCFPQQAARAIKKFPDARLHWFEKCGHLPHWDQPKETLTLILNTISNRRG